MAFTISAFDKKKMEEYAEKARETWGNTDAYKEYEQKTENLNDEEKNYIGEKMMEFFVEFGQMMDKEPSDEVVQAQVKKLQDYITDNFYTCTNQILGYLGRMYSGGGSMTENIDKAGGEGTAEFVHKAIEIYCEKAY